MENPLQVLAAAPFFRRVVWHARRLSRQVDRRFFLQLSIAVVGVVALAATLVTVIEKPISVNSFVNSFYWAVTTIFGQGDASFVTSPGGWLISWLLVLFGVGMLTAITGALLAFIIEVLLKEGQGMGASGLRDHIVVCGWNATARDLIRELQTDEYKQKIVLIHDAERSPADSDVYFVRGSSTNAEDLRRAGIAEASAAIICPEDGTDEADMHSILTVLAIESIAPEVRTVVEVNNPMHVEHFRRAEVDELLVTSKLASRLMARSALYPGLSSLVTDIVSGGDGSELYRVMLPEEYAGLRVDEASARLRAEHEATLLAIGRAGTTHTNPGTDFTIEVGDDAVVVALSLGTLHPLEPAEADGLEGALPTTPVPSAVPVEGPA